jgi:hypothetical protein
MTKRLTSLGVLTCLALAPLAVAAPAQAAWTPMVRIDGAKALVCKAPLGDGRVRVKLKLDNRGADHTHLSGLSRTRNGQQTSVEVRAAAGQVSGTKSVVWKRGDQLSTGIGEVTGEGAGTGFELDQVSRC